MKCVSSSVSFSTSAQAATQSPELTADAAQGRHLFVMNCAHCHGDDARGDEGPDLHNLHRSDARIHEVITAGIKGEMPSFGKKLGDPDVQATNCVSADTTRLIANRDLVPNLLQKTSCAGAV